METERNDGNPMDQWNDGVQRSNNRELHLENQIMREVYVDVWHGEWKRKYNKEGRQDEDGIEDWGWQGWEDVGAKERKEMEVHRGRDLLRRSKAADTQRWNLQSR